MNNSKNIVTTGSGRLTITKDQIDQKKTSRIEITQELLGALFIVKAILRAHVPIDSIAIRHNKFYCGVLLNNDNSKPLCRFYFNGKQKYLGVITYKLEERVPIDSIEDIFQHSDKIIETLREYISE